jgi:hypothetical protein
MKLIEMRTTSNEEKTDNQPDEDDSSYDDASDRATIFIAARNKKAQKNIGRAVLYGIGARAKLPKVERKKDDTKSPFTVLKPHEMPDRHRTINESVPPGIHSDLFRRVCNNTRKSREDPECYQYTTTSMTEGVNYAAGQPPWYCGYSNKTVPSDSSLGYAASRYGFRGSKGIKQYENSPYQMPQSTTTKYTPKFLNGSYIIDEWVPPILARTHQTINGMESPKLWPENSSYPSGAKMKKPSTSCRYNRETTIANNNNREIPPQLTKFIEKNGDINRMLSNFAGMETNNTFLSGPMTAQLTFHTMWNDRVQETASKDLKTTLGTTFLPSDPQCLSDASDKIQYAGNTAFIVHSQSADDLRYRQKLDNAILTTYENQWKQSIINFRLVKANLKRDTTMAMVIPDIAVTLIEHAAAAGMVTHLRRSDFMNSMRRIKFCNTLTSQQVSLLFNAFDPLKKNSIRFGDIISSWIVLDSPLDSAMDKLTQLWTLHAKLGHGLSSLDVSLCILTSCCSSTENKQAIEKLFKEQFRPKCYSMSLRDLSTNPNQRTTMSPSNFSSSPLLSPSFRTLPGQRSTSTIETFHDTEQNNTNSFNPRASTASNPRRPTALNTRALSASSFNGKLSSQNSFAPYSISDKFLVSPESFIEILKQCPGMLVLFNKQLSERMIECYGIDQRLEKKVIEKPPIIEDVDKDYSWILEGRPNKYKSDILQQYVLKN